MEGPDCIAVIYNESVGHVVIAIGSAVHGCSTAMKNLAAISSSRLATDNWQRFPVRQFEDLHNLVLGAGLHVVPMKCSTVGGYLAFWASDGVIFSSGHIDGDAIVKGVISNETVTVGIVLSQGQNSRICLRRVSDGAVGMVLPGDEIDALCRPGAQYITATLDIERLERMIERKVGNSAIHPIQLDEHYLDEIKSSVNRIHSGEHETGRTNIGRLVLEAIRSHYTTKKATAIASRPTTYEAIAMVGRNYIERNLARPIYIDDITAACGSSKRTLYRAFLEVIGETPVYLIRRLRLHRIHRDLTDPYQTTTISETARKWGIVEHGRMSGWYHELFGEQPSDTVAARWKRQHETYWL